MNKEFDWKSSLINALPYVTLVLGIAFFAYSTFGTFEMNSKWQVFWGGLGKTMLTGGIFALLLKVIQFMGVFKEELHKIIFEPRYLKNRKDLDIYWEKVSMELFKNKFPLISQKLLRDTRDIYFPTKEPYYYDSVEHFIEYSFVDQVAGIISVKRTTTLNVICNEKSEEYTYECGNMMKYKASKDEINYISTIIKVNGKEISDIETLVEDKNNEIHTRITVKLKGSEKYKIERIEEKHYNILDDNIMYFRANKITNKLTVEFHHPANLKIELKKAGTLEEFSLDKTNDTFKRYFYGGIMYPEQGYYANIKIV
jgi:hypothetical protein